MSGNIVILLIVICVVIGVLCIFERSWPWVMYWLGAAVLNGGILWAMSLPKQ